MAISKFLAERKLSLKFAHVYHAEIMGSGEANCPQADWGAFLPAHSLQVRTVHLKNDERPTQQYKIGYGKASRVVYVHSTQN